jgi:hypothetical protein
MNRKSQSRFVPPTLKPSMLHNYCVCHKNAEWMQPKSKVMKNGILITNEINWVRLQCILNYYWISGSQWETLKRFRLHNTKIVCEVVKLSCMRSSFVIPPHATWMNLMVMNERMNHGRTQMRELQHYESWKLILLKQINLFIATAVLKLSNLYKILYFLLITFFSWIKEQLFL